MGAVEFDSINRALLIHSHIITYGNAASPELTEQIRDEIETMWNEPRAVAFIESKEVNVVFRITAELKININELEVLQNDDPRNNYFRIEEFASTNISFVDGVGCNTGYFLLENLYRGSTTAAHEYGHTLGLDHPRSLDIRGKGIPGIMYPRGTLVNPEFQYDPLAPAGTYGGTLHPAHRKVLAEDIAHLKLHKLRFRNATSLIGDFTNVYHPPHM